jgi:hypothetical protein
MPIREVAEPEHYLGDPSADTRPFESLASREKLRRWKNCLGRWHTTANHRSCINPVIQGALGMADEAQRSRALGVEVLG